MTQHSRPTTPTGVGAKPWIKMRTDLWDDPRVSALCDALATDEAHIIGALYRLWSMADAHSTDGELIGLTANAVDRKCGLPGFAAALESVGWLATGDAGVTIPDFGIHNGQSAKSRAQTCLRQQARRKKQTGEADVSRTQRDTSASLRGQPCVTGVTRLDERRGDKTKREPPPPLSAPVAASLVLRDADMEAEVVEMLRRAGLAAATQTAADAIAAGYTADAIRQLTAELAQRPDLGPGALAWRLRETPHDVAVTDGWPAPPPRPTPAPEVEIGRYTVTWSDMRPSPRKELARQAGIALARHGETIALQGLRELPTDLRTPIVALLARAAGDMPQRADT